MDKVEAIHGHDRIAAGEVAPPVIVTDSVCEPAASTGLVQAGVDTLRKPIHALVAMAPHPGDSEHSESNKAILPQ